MVDRADRRWATKEIGLEAGYRLLKFAYDTEYLHYGLFESDIPPEIGNLKLAQERYIQRLFEMIPAGTRSILDVGCGSGKSADELLKRGYAVDCVSPGQVLTAVAAERLGDRARIYRGKFEAVEIEKRYDLVLFSESFQYIPIQQAFDKAIGLVNPGGHILICDYFRNTAKGKSPIGGGHDFEIWSKAWKAFPLELVAERDITAETSLTHDIITAFSREVLVPLSASADRAMSLRWPLATRMIRKLFRRKIQKFERRLAATNQTSATFREFKFYKIYLFRVKTGTQP